MSSPRFLVPPDTLRGGRATLSGDELRHLRARRLHVGSRVVLFDGEGNERSGVVHGLDRRHALVVLDDQEARPSPPSPRMTLAQGALKADKLDLVVEKATELGADEILVFTSERTVRVPRAERRLRWERLARSAAKQSQRNTVPQVRGPIPLEEVLRRTEACRLLFWEDSPRGTGPAWHDAASPASVLAVVGPEGGFAPREASLAAASAFQLVRLGLRPVRAETAAIVALGLCQFLWGELRQES